MGMASEHAPNATNAPRLTGAGFSLVEALVAAAVLTGVVLLATNLILRSRMDTFVGRRHTEASRLAGGSQEELRALPLDRQSLVVPAGRRDLSLEALWARGEGRWTEPPGSGAIWRRTTRVRQFAVADLYDQSPAVPATLDTPLDGGVEASQAHLRLIEVVIDAESAGPSGVGAGSRLTLVAIRAF